jgi:hypothetical protein
MKWFHFSFGKTKLHEIKDRSNRVARRQTCCQSPVLHTPKLVAFSCSQKSLPFNAFSSSLSYVHSTILVTISLFLSAVVASRVAC